MVTSVLSLGFSFWMAKSAARFCTAGIVNVRKSMMFSSTTLDKIIKKILMTFLVTFIISPLSASNVLQYY